MSPKHFNYSVVKNVESIDKSYSGGDSVIINSHMRRQTSQSTVENKCLYHVGQQTMGYYTYPHIHQQGEECKIHEGHIFSNLWCSQSTGQQREIHLPSAQYFMSCHNPTLKKVEPKSGGNEHSDDYDPFTFPFSAVTSLPAQG